MSYRYDKKKRTQKRWYAVGIIFLVFALFTNIYGWIFDVFEKPLVQSWENKEQLFSDTENFFEAFSSKKSLIEEHKRLQQEITRLSIQNLRTDYLASELESLYGLSDIDSDMVPAHVVLQESDIMMVDIGAQQNVTIGDKVIAYDNVAIGVVSEVYDTTSRIELYSKAGQSINGVLFPHNINLIAKGYGGGSFVIETPREIEVAEGDIFYSLEQPGRVIGIVRAIEFDARDPFKQVYLSYPVNLSEIQMIGVQSKKESIQ